MKSLGPPLDAGVPARDAPVRQDDLAAGLLPEGRGIPIQREHLVGLALANQSQRWHLGSPPSEVILL